MQIQCFDHKPVQHRDARPPWCDVCGRTADGQIPTGHFEKRNPMSQLDMQERAKLLVAQYHNSKVEKTDDTVITTDDVYVVWFVKALKNWKALVSTTVSDGMYYEVTHNGEKGETYLDVYKKWDNIAVSDGADIRS